MADTEMQKAQAASQAGAELQEKGKDELSHNRSYSGHQLRGRYRYSP